MCNIEIFLRGQAGRLQPYKILPIQVQDSGSRNIVCTETVHVTDLLRGSWIFATSGNKVGVHNELLIFLF